MKIKKDVMYLGIILGIIAPMLAILVFYLVSDHSMNPNEFVMHLFRYKLVSHMISIGAIANLVVFFIFIKLNYLKTARGVVFSTMVYAIFVAIAKFI